MRGGEGENRADAEEGRGEREDVVVVEAVWKCHRRKWGGGRREGGGWEEESIPWLTLKALRQQLSMHCTAQHRPWWFGYRAIELLSGDPVRRLDIICAICVEVPLFTWRSGVV